MSGANKTVHLSADKVILLSFQNWTRQTQAKIQYTIWLPFVNHFLNYR